MTACTNCGEPIDATDTEEHHVDQQRGNNDPDNLTQRCRRCHHSETHDNRRAVDKRTNERYGPRTPQTGPP